MFVIYSGQLYRLIERSMHFDDAPALATDFKEKTDGTFFHVESSDYYIKEIKLDDPRIEEIFEVDYFVVYDDKSETVAGKRAKLKEEIKRGEEIDDSERDAVFNHIWSANGGAPISDPPKIQNNEVELILCAQTRSPDWIEFEWGWCCKAVNIYDCERLFVRYTYTVRGGKKLAKEEVVEVDFTPEEFKKEKLKYSWSNI